MLMHPQNPDPKFDFMLKDGPQPKRDLGLSAVNKPIKIAAAAIIGIVIIIVVSSVLSGRKGNGSQSIIDAIARGHEIVRITQLIQPEQFQDPGTAALAATINSTLSSQQSQLTSYLALSHTKVSNLQLAADTDKSEDAQLQTAAQNGQLDSVYKDYLNQNLAKYQSDLQAAYKSVGPKGKQILQEAFDSNKVLLASAPLKS